MLIFPAIDLIDGEAVRLYKGEYDKKTTYSKNPIDVAKEFERLGAKYIHVVDLDGAKNGETPNLEIIKKIKKETSLFVEVGGGIRNLDTVKKYVDSGIDRVIIGTAAVKDPKFLKEAVDLYKDKVSVGIDCKEGYVAIKGWLETTSLDIDTFMMKMINVGIKHVIVTDISKDGAMEGTNLKMYESLSKKYDIDITASGGVSSIDDVKALKKLNMYAAIIGKAYYIGEINLSEAIEVSK